MIRLLAHLFSRQHVVSLSQSSCVSSVELTDSGEEGMEGEGVDEVLYKSFNTLWEQPNNTLVK
jgi:hypothetical protein